MNAYILVCIRFYSYVQFFNLCSFVMHKIPVKHIYVTVCNLNSTVFGKACAWRVLDMMPSLKKSATLDQTNNWRKLENRRLRLHHGCIAHVVDMINRFGSKDKHLLCADGMYIPLIPVHTSTY